MLNNLTSAFTFILAQENGGGEGGGVGAGSYQLIIYIVIFIGIFYFLLIRPGQKQRKMHQELVQAIRKGDEVVTAGGIHGKVTKVADDYVMLEIAKKTEVKMSRGSVTGRQSVEAEPPEEEAGEEETTAPEEKEEM